MSHHLLVHGRRLEYRWWPPSSPPAATPLLLLHEGLGSVGLWRDFPEALAARTGRATAAYSRLGHGASDPRGTALDIDFMHEEAERVVPSVLDALGLDRAVLVGHSDGASIALLYAATHDLPGLVVLAPHTFVEESGLREIARTRTAYEEGLRERMARHHRDPDVVFRNWNDVWLHPGFLAWNIERALPRVTCPVLVIQGEADEYGTAKQVEAIAAGVGGAVETVWLGDCGHSPHRDQPAAVLDAVAAFLAAHT
ncbi:MAG: alpha/beta fold hydrolase [Vicinamibacteria bacterium]